MSALNHIYDLLGRFKYWVVIVGIILVDGFLDENSAWMRYQRLQVIDQLRNEIDIQRAQYLQADAKLHELEHNPREVERLAREKYRMKRANEDVFIVMEGTTELPTDTTRHEGIK